MRNIEAKSILSKSKGGPDPWFGTGYSMNLYRGCQHGCIYCDSRSDCYGLKDLSDIRIKSNAIELLEMELRKKKQKMTICTGSMNDPYMPVEKEMEHTRKALELIARYRYPVHIITKSDLVLRDLDILNEIKKVYAAVSITITTADDALAKKIEPAAPSSSQRFEAIATLRENGIYAGVLVMPILPFINDNLTNIESLVKQSKETDAQYILASMGMTLRDSQRDYYYQKLDKHFPGLRSKYEQSFGNKYSCGSSNYKALNTTFKQLCQKANIPTHMNFFKEDKPEQLKLF